MRLRIILRLAAIALCFVATKSLLFLHPSLQCFRQTLLPAPTDQANLPGLDCAHVHIDLGLMIAVVAERAEHLRQRQMRQSFGNLFRRRPQPPTLHNRPNWRARSLDDRLAAENIGIGSDVKVFGDCHHTFL
jgi:hypothetical protein